MLKKSLMISPLQFRLPQTHVERWPPKAFNR